MQLPILPEHRLDVQTCLMEEFFLHIYEPVFVLDLVEEKIRGFNHAFARLFSNGKINDPIELNNFRELIHENDRERFIYFLSTIPNQNHYSSEGINIRINAKDRVEKIYNLRIRRKNFGDKFLLSGSLHNVTDKIDVEQLQAHNNNTLRELSFITSHELRHEYAKIQSIIQMLDKDIVDELEKKELIEGARESIQIINSTIFKINHKLSFNQSDAYFKKQNEKIRVNKVIIVDDDHLTNIINKKVLKTFNPVMDIEIFSQTEDALEYLKVNDTAGNFLILLDVNFPHSSGWDFLNQYEKYFMKSRVVVLSSSIDNVDKQRAGAYAVVSNYITKPLTLERVKELLQ